MSKILQLKKIIFALVFSIVLPNISAQESSTPYEFKLIASGLEFPEGPAWDGKNTLYASNCYGDWITKASEGEAGVFVKSPSAPIQFEKTNGLTVFEDGSIFACDYGLGAILRFSPEGECEIFLDGYNGEKFNRPNDLAFDGKGNLYFTDPKSYDDNILDGKVYMVNIESRDTKIVADELAFPNGIAFTQSGEDIFICESAKNRILRYKVGDDGTLSGREVFVSLPGGDPDGIAFDLDGNLFVAHFGSGRIFKVSEAGKIISEIETPGKKPTNLEFGDADMKTLYITETETNSIYSIRVETPGLKLHSSP